MSWHRGFLPACVALLGLAFLESKAVAHHPVARRSHDRVLTLRLTPGALVVDYHLEVDSWTVVFVDLPPLNDQVDLGSLKQPREFYEAFTRLYAPILAGNLVASVNGQPLVFQVDTHRHESRDSVQCDFRFRASWTLPEDGAHDLVFREGNYETEPGTIQVSLDSSGVDVASLQEASPALKIRPPTEWQPGDEERLRRLSATFTLSKGTSVATEAPEPVEKPSAEGESLSSMLHDWLERPWGFWAALALMLGWGSYHALTPGHGKTLVAAYLVGERGTWRHALFLGIVTTLSHTGALLAIAALFRVAPEQFNPLIGWLGPLGGLLVTGMGVWLLLCRLTGRADHVHVVGGHHHHEGDNGHGGAYHEGHSHSHGAPPDAGWGRLLLLGITGGMIPCPAAILITLALINAQRLELALPLLLAFSAGLGGVLVAIGVGVVYVKGFAESRWGAGRRLFRTLPLVSALLVTVLGLWMLRDAMPR